MLYSDLKYLQLLSYKNQEECKKLQNLTIITLPKNKRRQIDMRNTEMMQFYTNRKYLVIIFSFIADVKVIRYDFRSAEM